jgi:excinuclease ABC subunit B
MYADKITESMQKTIDETSRRREKQLIYNQVHGITPTPLQKSKADILGQSAVVKIRAQQENHEFTGILPEVAADPVVSYLNTDQLQSLLSATRKKMEQSSRELDFMEAARLRDEMLQLEKLINEKSEKS